MKSLKMKISNSIFYDSDNDLWSNEPLIINDSEFKEDFFLFYSKKKQSYKNKPLKRAGSIIKKTKKNGEIIWCDVTNAFLEIIELQHVGQGLRITKNEQSLEFFGYLENWTRDLKKFCIQTQIKSHYIISNKLGCGSFANVHRVIRKNDQKEFAAKIYDKHLEQFDKESVLKELEILRKMDHPNVITVLEAFESPQYIFIITEQFTFGNLDEMLTNTIISEEDAIRGMYKILDALASVHSKGVIHRDIKPENILFRKPNLDDIIVSDFGLADFLNSEGLYKYHRCGTPGNIAPEVLKDQPYDFKVDTYSAGIIFYQMIAQGKSPFIVDDLKETLSRNEFGLVDFTILNTSAGTKALIQQMLEVDPAKRCTVQEAKNSVVFKKYNRQTIIIKRRRMQQDQTVSSYSPRSTSIYQSNSNQASPQIVSSPYQKFIGSKNLHTIPLRLRSHERKLFSSPSSCNSSANQNQLQKNRNSNFKINIKNNKTSLYFAMNSNKVI